MFANSCSSRWHRVVTTSWALVVPGSTGVVEEFVAAGMFRGGAAGRGVTWISEAAKSVEGGFRGFGWTAGALGVRGAISIDGAAASGSDAVALGSAASL